MTNCSLHPSTVPHFVRERKSVLETHLIGGRIMCANLSGGATEEPNTRREQCDHHLEPDVLECEVQCALGSTATDKASGGDGIWLKLLTHMLSRTFGGRSDILQE